jgi:hypothetical protein
MARLSVGQKAQRLPAFLMGLGNAQIMRALQPYGFDQTKLDEGWALLRRTTASQLGAQSVPSTREQVARLDAWENHWFPIAFAVLQRHHPDVHEKVFHKLGQTEGNEVVLSVGTFVERVDGLPAMGEGPALATLIQHGMTEAVLGEARGLLTQLMQPRIEDPPTDDVPIVDPAAEDAMWSYYLQWSAIARRAISERRLLRQLGFRRSLRGGSDEPSPGNEAPGETPAGPGETNGPATQA